MYSRISLLSTLVLLRSSSAFLSVSGTTSNSHTILHWARSLGVEHGKKGFNSIRGSAAVAMSSTLEEKATRVLASRVATPAEGIRFSVLLYPGLKKAVDKDGNLKRAASTFRDTVSATDPKYKPGAFVRSDSEFRNAVTKDDQIFTPEAGRYHLYVCYACPWSQRALIAWALKGLEGIIGMSATHPTWQKTRPDDDNDQHYGWAFANPDDPPFVPPSGYGEVPSDGSIPDPLHGFKMVRDMYDMAVQPGSLKKYTVPVLWDNKTKTIVNNESSEIIRMFNTAFNNVEGVTNPGLDLAPAELEGAMAEVDGWMYDEVCNGVYKAGFAKSQQAYDVAVKSLFLHLEKLEKVLGTRRYLAGDKMTLSDVRVFPSLVRFDEVYSVYFKCNKKRIVDYPNIVNYVRDLYQTFPEGFAATTHMDHIKRHYYTSHKALNTFSIIPVGPDFMSTLAEDHDRDRHF